jgi:hypothetical protein
MMTQHAAAASDSLGVSVCVSQQPLALRRQKHTDLPPPSCNTRTPQTQDLRRSNFTSADIRKANFKGSNLQGAYLMKVVAFKTNFEVRRGHESPTSLVAWLLAPELVA